MTKRGGDVLARKTPDILPRTPNRMRKTQQNRPAVRFAHRVIAMTPLFCSISMSTERHTIHNAIYLGKDRQGRDCKESRQEAANAIALQDNG